MIELIEADDSARWDEAVRSLPDWDVYYLNAYSRSLALDGKGRPLLALYSGDGVAACMPVVVRDVADSPLFGGILGPGSFLDAETPYGYGGPLMGAGFGDAAKERFVRELGAALGDIGVVSLFVRFSPMTYNWAGFEGLLDTRFVHHTVLVDTTSPDGIDANMTSKNRNMVRKAMKSGVSVERRPITNYAPFLEMYRATMDRHAASQEYYMFDEGYFDFLGKEMGDSSFILYSMFEGEPIGGAVFWHNGTFMHYHLSGSDFERRALAGGNLVLYEAAHMACGMGVRALHLGGGVSDEDSLYRFKRQFSKDGVADFHVGRLIVDPGRYRRLCELREEADPGFDAGNGYMIQYRKPN